MNDHYTYRITWSVEANEHAGLCAEFPSLSWLAPTPAAALSGIQRLVRECLADMRATGEAVPEPIADRNYSGNSWCVCRRNRTAPSPSKRPSKG